MEIAMTTLEQVAESLKAEGIEQGRQEERQLILDEIQRCIGLCQNSAKLCKESGHTEAMEKHHARESELNALHSRIQRGLK
jgi:hypothetical protein